jgi:hypothetical protein
VYCCWWMKPLPPRRRSDFLPRQPYARPRRSGFMSSETLSHRHSTFANSNRVSPSGMRVLVGCHVFRCTILGQRNLLNPARVHRDLNPFLAIRTELYTASCWHVACFRFGMSCVADLEPGDTLPAATPAPNNPRFRNGSTLRSRVLRTGLLGVGCVFVFSSHALRGEEPAPCVETSARGALLPYALVLHSTASTIVSFTPHSGVTSHGVLSGLGEEARSRAFLAPSPPRERTGRINEVMLLRTRMPSRHAYDSWAGVQTGYGQFFPDDKIGRLRTSGAGLQDPDWLFVKLSFRF